VILTITSTNQGSVITNCNTQIKSLLGYDKEELLSKDLAVIQHPMFQLSHEYSFTNYLQKWEIKEEEIHKLIFPTTKKGFFTPVELDVRIKPSLE
jgi:PAS domain S-box-containing protein